MKKSIFIGALALTLVSSALVGCGKKNNSSTSSTTRSSIYDPDDPSNSIQPGSIAHDKTFADALSFDYDNYSVVYAQLYGDGSNLETAYEYYVDGVTILLDYTYAEMTGEIDYDFYASTDEDDYAYWEKADGYDYDGWISNGWRDADLAMYHAYFDLHHFLSALSPDDVETILGMAFVKTESMYKLQDCGLEFFGDPFLADEEITSVSFSFDKDTGAITKIIGSVSDTSDDGFEIEISNVGNTVAPAGVKVPKLPYYNSDTDRNIYTYPEMKGDDFVPDVWPERVNLAVVGEATTETGFDAVIDIDESVEIAYDIFPSNTNRIEFEWKVSNPDVIDLNHKTNFTSRHKYATGESAGECEVSIKLMLETGEYIESNKLKIKVKPLKEQDKTNAIYDLTITGSDYKRTGSGDEEVIDKNVTILSAYNKINTTAQFSIKGHNVKAVEVKNTDSFGANGMAAAVSPASQDYMNNGFYSEVEFDFGDQEVCSISFLYALYKANQRDYAVRNLETAYIATSNDGITWNEPIDMQEEMVYNFSNINLDYLSNQKLMERSFPHTSHVKLYFESRMVGTNFDIVMNSFVFCKDETCHDHGTTVEIPVESVVINSTKAKTKLDGNIQFGYQVSPETATNKNVSWHVSDATVGSIDATGLFRPLNPGNVDVFAVSSNGIESNRITVTVVGQEYLDSKYVGNKYLSDDVFVNSDWHKVVLEIKDTLTAKLTVDETTLTFTYYTKDDSSRPFHTYNGANGETLKVKFYDDNVEVFLSGSSLIELGNAHTNTGEELPLFVASKSIKLTHDTKEITSVTLKVGETYAVYATVNPTNAYYKSVKAISKNTSVATVAPQEYAGFVVTAVGDGTTEITFENDEGIKASLTVTVSTPIGVESLSISSSKTSIEVGEKLTVNAVLNPTNADDYSLSWSIDDTTFATISGNGTSATITAKKVGEVVVTLTDTKSGQTAELTLTITASTSVVPASFVGVWSGMDGVGTDFTVEIFANGTVILSDGSSTWTFAYVSNNGSTYTFSYSGDEGDITMCIWGSSDYEKTIEIDDGTGCAYLGDLMFFGTTYIEK